MYIGWTCFFGGRIHTILSNALVFLFMWGKYIDQMIYEECVKCNFLKFG